jgi:hypothetical protein
MRPHGTYGGIAVAMRSAAQQGPGTVRELAERAQVGYTAARYTASRLCNAGELVVLDGLGRPAVLAAASAVPVTPAGDGLGDALDALHACFWAGAGNSEAQALEDDDPGGI